MRVARLTAFLPALAALCMFAEPVPALATESTIGNWVWHDLNADGIANQPGSPAENEPSEIGQGMANVHVILHQLTPSVTSSETWTNSNGEYQFNNLTVGEYYQLEFVPPAGYEFTFPDATGNELYDSDVDRSTGRTVVFQLLADTGTHWLQWDAGLILNEEGNPWDLPECFAIGDLAWIDVDGDGIQDDVGEAPDGEPVLQGVQVALFQADVNGEPVLTAPRQYATTNTEGQYSFCVLAAD
jgi:serine-aspartate repeat-containing protein C/D/E